MADVEITITVGLRDGTRHMGTRWSLVRDAGTDPEDWAYEIRAAINDAAQADVPGLIPFSELDRGCQP